MTTGTTKRIIINEIRRFRNNSTGEVGFIVNGNDRKNSMFLNGMFVAGLFAGMGINRKTSFLKLVGSTIKYKELNVTQEMLDANNGVVTVEADNRAGMIEFKKPGIKHFDQNIEKLSTTFQNSIDNAAVHFEDDWMGETTPAPRTEAQAAAPTIPAPEAHEEPAVQVVTEEADLTEEA